MQIYTTFAIVKLSDRITIYLSSKNNDQHGESIEVTQYGMVPVGR
jgi:hypothetical protein